MHQFLGSFSPLFYPCAAYYDVKREKEKDSLVGGGELVDVGLGHEGAEVCEGCGRGKATRTAPHHVGRQAMVTPPLRPGTVNGDGE